MTADAADSYRQAERRLRELLFGDGVYSAGLVRGDEQRNRVTAALHRMREAFEELAEAMERDDAGAVEDPSRELSRSPRA